MGLFWPVEHCRVGLIYVSAITPINLCIRRVLPKVALSRIFFPTRTDLVLAMTPAAVPKGKNARSSLFVTLRVVDPAHHRLWRSSTFFDRFGRSIATGKNPALLFYCRCHRRQLIFVNVSSASIRLHLLDIPDFYVESFLWLPCRFHSWIPAIAPRSPSKAGPCPDTGLAVLAALANSDQNRGCSRSAYSHR